MPKPTTIDGYNDGYTQACERVLVTLLRGLGPWKKSVYLIGGLTPRYLIKARPPKVPAHAGTTDVDLVVDLQILTDTEAYQTLEENLKKLNFERAENARGQKQSWRWRTQTENGATMIVEFLADDPERGGGKVQVLPTDGNVSALNIPHASIVMDLCEVVEVNAELLDGNGIATEQVRHADLVSFTCLKALAFDDRAERKDAHDLVYCLEHAEGGLDAVAAQFRQQLTGMHGDVVRQCLGILRTRFASTTGTEGHRKDGCVAVAKFEHGDSEEAEHREARALRQREVASLIEEFLARL
jgi:hypothetical protein